jgi:hypothetical protein
MRVVTFLSFCIRFGLGLGFRRLEFNPDFVGLPLERVLERFRLARRSLIVLDLGESKAV